MSINVRPSKRIVEEKKENVVKLSENAKKLVDNLEKMESSEKLFSMEDKIAMEMTHEKIYNEFQEDSNFLRKLIDEYLEGKPTTTAAIAKIARLRRNTRLCHYATAQIRKEVADRMESVDAKLLQLQNVTSEVQHIQKEIDRCLDFSAGDEDLELIQVDEFYQLAPESLSKPDETMGNEHEQYVARLKFEANQRQDLLSTLSELEGRRSVLVSDIRGKEGRLQGLKPKLEDLAKIAEPAFEIVGAKFRDLSVDEEQRQLSLTLPTPLAVAHIHAQAYKEIHDDKQFDYRIVGNNENGKQTKEEGDLTKRRRKEDEGTSEKVNEMAASIFDVHPMSLEFDVESDDVKITMSIHYLTELKVLTAKWHVNQEHSSKSRKSVFFSADTLLSDLFEKDSGDVCPNPVGDMKVDHLKLNFEATAKTIGKPYRFVQELSNGVDGQHCGISVTEHLRKVVKAIRERIAHRFVLDGMVRSLESRKIDELNNGGDVKINTFKHMDYESFISNIPTRLSSLISTAGVSDRFPFKIEVENGSGKKVCAFLSIPADYPKHIVMFGIVAPEESNEEVLKDIEDRLNAEADYVDDVNSLKEQLNLLVKHIDLS